ncbi:hypothetical protein KP004_08120 [Geomonas oryzisoli]|uniref:Uncharacterized protein n=1 Tax=Geomonas oryzisoli TaxID=2847992 RepID=A0ABX8JDG5_9BACT|nr:hypothetical protein [Geomonas oryzisoli]QWV95131.1 hypothetical protein KP004_08120 [Geomonas oryzisoli]
MSDWQEQWERVNRYYDRFERMNGGVEAHGEPADYYFDDMWSFFQNCFHLRDWLKAGHFCPDKIAKSPDAYVNENEFLAICADLANATKHMMLTHRPKSGAEPKRVNRSLAVTGGSPVVTFKAAVKHKANLIDAFQLATHCMAAWREYLPD